MQYLAKTTGVLAGIAFAVATTAVQAEDWSATEIHLQYGNLEKAFQGSGGGAETDGTTIITFQHAGGWKYGDNFFFIDYLNYGKTEVEEGRGSHSDDEFYGEWYSNFSLGAITGSELKFGPVKDIGLIAGFNFAAEVDTLYYLPGVRLALNIPGFAFANVDITAYIQNGSSAPVDGVSIREDDAFMVDFNWAYPFKIGGTSWSIEGHIEYIDGADQDVRIVVLGGVINNTGERESWILAQPQLRFDLGEAIGGAAGQLYVGLEYQFWKNKLGAADTDESVAQLLAVWHF